MRVLTDPVEIRAFRKKQTKKILRMVGAELVSFGRKTYFKARTLLTNMTIVFVCAAIWLLCVAIGVAALNAILSHCAV